MKHWPIMIIFACDVKKKLDMNAYSFGNLSLYCHYTTLWNAKVAIWLFTTM